MIGYDDPSTLCPTCESPQPGYRPWVPGDGQFGTVLCPDPYHNRPLLSRKTADKTILFLLGVMAGGAAFACALAASPAAAIAATSVLLGVWVVAFVVWMLWA